ncbi:MAG TPA: cytochrome c biogenesis protein/redoxin [Pyrinomonadaceae bacterium]|jgi:cytochrome c-type biogenesis protein|nr:cytochrome c biogenesis protein/redoxin [Pyrinomonadaceae bacterium]HWP53546.1 cytochrome c biogenesis protein/redoxin [Pyrinomonadaceae bacterium]
MQVSLFFNIVVAFVAGMLSFLSPCVLPLVPGYISLMSGVSIDNLKSGGASGSRRAVILNSLAFNAGLSVIFLALGGTAGLLGSAIFANTWVRVIAGLVIIVFGLHLIGLLKIKYLYRDTRQFSSEKPQGILGSLTLGIAFAAGWTPCIGPILGGIIGLAATTGGWKNGLLLSAFYSAGLAVPFLVTGLTINKFLSFYSKFRKHLHKVEVVSGVILILIGVLVMSNRVTLLSSSWLASVLPNLESRLKLRGGTPTPDPQKTSYTPAPDVQFTKLDGSPFRLQELRGRVVLLNFWATWCVPCRSEIPSLSAMQKDLEPQGLSIIGVSYDDTADLIQQFQQDIPQSYQIVLGGREVGAQLPASPLPTTYIIDRQGRIRDKLIGERSRAAFESVIKPLLDEAQTTAQKNE